MTEKGACSECGGDMEESLSDTGYSIWKCIVCGYEYSEE